ncbi:hypothetical protein BKK52_10600 [Rodentibacter trehalosifermentans]|uniref:Putative tail fiber protein gp53-like C-terminal domain-containing protein n=1 Tax=Rodentibacter trehalosifermentans TaxID=1908263 RepID=A0A1V3IY79_9PAST|nr:hypothetical protein BKK52_10600 [Rodentibacter trehalosifermentans]
MKTLLPEINSADKRFHNGNPATGEQGTRVTDTWLNDVQDRIRDIQEEAHYVLQQAGFTPKAETKTQLYQAIVKIIEDNRQSATTKKSGIVQLNSATNSTSETEAATPKAVKTAYDKGVDALNKANEVDSATLKKTGNQTLNGYLKTTYSSSRGWAGYQFDAAHGVWQLEVNPAADTAGNRRFNMKWMPNSGTSVYLSFPHIGDKGDIVAYQSWVNNLLNEFKKGNDYIKRIGNNHNIQLRWNGNGNLDLKIDNTELGQLHYTNQRYVSVTANDGAYAGLHIQRKGSSGNYWARAEALPDRRWKFVTEGGASVFMKNKSGTVALVEDFTQNLSANGWTKLPNGLLIQWASGKGSTKNNFPIAFRQVFSVAASQTCNGDANYDVDIFYTNTQFWGRYQTAYRVIAIGI